MAVTTNKITNNTIIKFSGNVADLPGKLKNIKQRWSQTDVSTVYNTNPKTALSVSVDLYFILRGIAGKDPAKTFFMGKTAKGYCAEITDVATGAYQIISVTESKEKLKISAAEGDANGVLKPYNSAGNRKGTLIVLGLMLEFLKDAECQSFFNECIKYAGIDPDDQIWDSDPCALEEFGKALCGLSNNLYYRTRYADTCGHAAVVFDENISVLRNSDISKSKVVLPYKGTTPKYFPVAASNATANATSGKSLKGKYSILSRDLTEEEKKLVPTMAPWYITPTWVETEAKVIKASTMFPIPFRSLLLYGVSGTGKTEGARAIFSGLGLPSVSICCNVDMTMFDFLGNLIPNVNKYGNKKTAEEVASSLHIPSYEDVENDFETTYRTLFGVDPDEYAGPADCYAKISELMAKSASDGESDFIYVESEFVKAYRNGWGIEIQEPTIIKRNSVLAGLNKALDNDPAAASITLPTGEIVRRHPDCVVIMTTNQDYDGCNNIQQSVLSRMQNKRIIPNPTTDELVERTVSETNFPDKKMLGTMAGIIREINEFCNSADVTDGVCGPRELTNWAKRAYINAVIETEDPKIKTVGQQYVLQAAFPTIIEKVSQTAEDQESVVIEVIQKHFAEGDVMMAKDEYTLGAA